MFRKKAFIYNWWVGTKSERLRFVDIFTKDCLTNECIIVGQVHTPFYDMETSRNPVVKVTKRGVITASGRFYPFSTAHPLYLMYLKEIHNKERGIIAFNWRDDRTEESKIETDAVLPDGGYMENVIIDFVPLCEEYKRILGFSETLQSKVVLHAFDQKPINPTYRGWVSMTEVRDSAIELSEKQRHLVKEMAILFKRTK